MEIKKHKNYQSHGSGKFKTEQFKCLGTNVIIENGVLVFHPEHTCIGDNVYIGHNTILKSYYKNEMIIGSHTWIGQNCFIHSAGGIVIGKGVGIGPMVKIISSSHEDGPLSTPVMFNKLIFKKVVLEDGCDIGAGTVILPGIKIGEGAIIGAGSVVTKDIPSFTVAAGVPARPLRKRTKKDNET